MRACNWSVGAIGLVLLGLGGLGCGGKPAAVQVAEAPDRERLQGVWRPVDAIADGERIPDPESRFATASVEFAGTRVLFKVAGEVAEINEFVLDPQATPRGIDLTVVDGNGVVQRLYDAENRPLDWVRKGIYEIDGDRLRICTPDGVGVPRPDSFEAQAGTGLTVMTFQKVR